MSLVVEHLSKRYGQQLAVQDLSLAVGKAEVVGFLGPNGAGKSTTMKIVCGYLAPTSGRVQVCGVDVQADSLAARRHIGYLPEHNPLYLDLYVREYLHYAAGLSGLRGADARRRMDAVIEQTGLGPEAHKPLGSLSKGYRQRAGLAQALLHDPEVLILDEPTSGLDPNQVVGIRDLIRELGREKTVVFSSHILQEVQAVATRVLILHQGQLRYDAPMAEAQAQVSGEQVLYLELERPGFDFAVLQAHPGVRSVVPQAAGWRIRAAADTDIRRLVFDESVRQDNALVTLQRESQSLEGIFRALTGQAAEPAATVA